MGCGVGWHDGDLGHGPAYRFRDPDGHVYRDLLRDRVAMSRRRRKARAEKPGAALPRPRRPTSGGSTTSTDWPPTLGAIRDSCAKALGSRLTEQIVLDNGERRPAAGSPVNNKSYDIAYCARLRPAAAGRFHHVTFAVDSREDILRAADIFLENGDLHRDRSAQARDPADLLHLCLGAGRQPRSNSPMPARG